jgi:hypothetical protein
MKEKNTLPNVKRQALVNVLNSVKKGTFKPLTVLTPEMQAVFLGFLKSWDYNNVAQSI